MRTYELSVNGNDYKIKVKSFNLDTAELEINGEMVKIAVKNMGDDLAGRPLPTRSLSSKTPVAAAATSSAPKTPSKSGGSGGKAVTAPIPGAIMEIFVKEGQEIKTGQPVLKMEAMKMENIINSDFSGTVQSISVNPGDAVSQGQELVLIG
jgi:glutaconyl-CoA/methylmalonyl-CoA decarboxylase subunit gamma